MNEQLTVKNFGPIKDATVDFKRVTVFIGPTGGGKSTLAKLAAILKQDKLVKNNKDEVDNLLEHYGMQDFEQPEMKLNWINSTGLDFSIDNRIERKSGPPIPSELLRTFYQKNASEIDSLLNALIEDAHREIGHQVDISQISLEKLNHARQKALEALLFETVKRNIFPIQPHYLPSERIFIAALEYSWAGLMRDDIGLPKVVLDFANDFSLARKAVSELTIPFLKVTYKHVDGRDFIKISEREDLIALLRAASGIQSVTPLLVLLEHLSRNTEQTQSFIIEEPELNLYPTAQQGLLNWLVEKCTKGENDLTITTHSPYILSHLNLLLYAYQVGNKDEEKRAKVKAIIPEEYWINPDEFAAYYVNGPEGANGVRSLVDAETKLISQNGLDDVSGIQATQFDQLLDINGGF